MALVREAADRLMEVFEFLLLLLAPIRRGCAGGIRMRGTERRQDLNSIPRFLEMGRMPHHEPRDDWPQADDEQVTCANAAGRGAKSEAHKP